MTAPQRMRAVRIDSGKVEVISVPVPEPGPGFALVKTILAGICNTDLELQRGYYGFSGIPGHEFVGQVIATDDTALIGRRVAGEINLACGRCSFCLANLPRHCLSRSVLGIVSHPGAFAEYLTLPVANLQLVPDSVPDHTAVFVEPVAAACEILEQVSIPQGEPVAVLGDGKLGLLVAQVLHAAGAAVTLFGHHATKQALAAARGISIADASSTGSTPQFRIVVDCTGSAKGLGQAIRMAKPRGTVVMKSTVHESVALDMAPVIVNEISLVGSRCGPFPPAIELLRKHEVEVAQMIHAEYALEQAPEAFEHAAARGVLKVLLRPDRDAASR